MSALLGKLGKVVGVGGFVVNPRGLVKHAYEARRECRVAAVSITDAGVGGAGEHAVWDGVSLGGDVVFALAQIVVHVQRHVVKAHHLGVDVSQFGLFFKQEPHCGHAVLEWQSGDGDGVVLINHCLACAYDVELQVVTAAFEEEVEEVAEVLCSLGVDVYGESAGAAVQVER